MVQVEVIDATQNTLFCTPSRLMGVQEFYN